VRNEKREWRRSRSMKFFFEKNNNKHSDAAALWPTTASEQLRPPPPFLLRRAVIQREKRASLSSFVFRVRKKRDEWAEPDPKSFYNQV
jgi:hypothetical protein